MLDHAYNDVNLSSAPYFLYSISRIYPSYREALSSIHTSRMRHAVIAKD
jgi:hypothetical protein